jgi:site-specific DNA-cytosine methylase
MPVAKWNFLETPMIGNRAGWPEEDLSDTLVIAHPPCAAFSVQGSTRKAASGLASSHFRETEEVMKYAMRLNCRVLLIESVVPAMEGARATHDRFAKKYGYRVLRILQNATTFGVPQWRLRFWIVFLREKGKFPRRVPIGHTPRFRAVGQVLDLDNLAEPSEKDAWLLEDQVKKFKKNGITKRQIEAIFSGEQGYGHLQSIVKKYLGLRGNLQEIVRQYCVAGPFLSNTMSLLNPAGFTPVLLSTALWCVPGGRMIGTDDYKAIAGFPRDYLFEGKAANKFREYLSKGVAPPVAAWLLAWLLDLCVGKLHDPKDYDAFFVLEDGDVADFNVKKEEALKRVG